MIFFLLLCLARFFLVLCPHPSPEIWWSAPKKTIVGVQRRATLWIMSKTCGEISYVERLKHLNILPCTVLWKRRSAPSFNYKCMNKKSSRYWYWQLFTYSTKLDAAGLFLPCQDTLLQHNHFLKLKKFSYFNRIVKLWNCILCQWDW